MKGAAIAAATAAVLSAADATTLPKRADARAPRVLHMPIERRTPSKPVISRSMLKRNTISESLTNFESGSLYFANVTIGTPPQSFQFHIDTGSSDLWTNVADSQLCKSDARTERQGGVPCSVSGTYDNSSSSTAAFVNNDFDIQYADGTGAKGPYLTDVVRFSQATIQNQQFGVGVVSSSAEGVMGIGYPALETIVANEGQASYKNIPQQMVDESIISSPAYSLWLDELSSPTGNILFGGIDKDKFTGSLAALPIQQVQGQFVEMIVTLNGVSYIDTSGNNNTVMTTPIPVLLDSGSTLSFLPTDTASSIYDAVGAQFDSQAQIAFCNCDLAQSSQTLDFEFDGKVISVGMEELVLPGGDGGQGSDTGCVFGIVSQSGSGPGLATSYTLGDSFIRNAYVVYDMSANQISLAQSNFGSTTSDIQEISPSDSGSGTSGVAEDSSTSAAATIAVRPSAALGGLAGLAMLAAALL